MIEYGTFEEWLRGQRKELQTLVDDKQNICPLEYIKVLAQALAVQQTINAWEHYERE